eukprot:CAMPEP_0196814144 /NCGR_PEP_ID=MMETSP1362-20130617/41613_1 /TAXON_ID=163516 /ORGANISM="Leptocylindrus danicus, Strain CCMP1856" /LENGTH=257 /DNA_ID=CAMNT_0042190669 /DNA_START=38 /DNA_END=812 /DNA_ORIENTATION=-
MSRHRYSVSQDSLIPTHLLNDIAAGEECTTTPIGLLRRRLGKSSSVAAYLSPEIRALCLELPITPRPVDDFHTSLNKERLVRSRTYPNLSAEEDDLSPVSPVKNLDSFFACNKEQDSVLSTSVAVADNLRDDSSEISTPTSQFDNAESVDNGADVSVLSEFSALSLKENVPPDTVEGGMKQEVLVPSSTRFAISSFSLPRFESGSSNSDFDMPDEALMVAGIPLTVQKQMVAMEREQFSVNYRSEKYHRPSCSCTGA